MAPNWLVVDDLRIVGNLSYLTDRPNVTTVRTVAAAIERLTNGQYDILWLDHDLGADGTIMPLIDWLCERAFNGHPAKPELIAVHSDNPSGVKTMLQTLERYGYNVVRAVFPY